MVIDLEKTGNLPEEIYIYKKSVIEENDPIKKEIFTFSEIAFIINNIVPFPVTLEHFYKLEDKYSEEHLLTMLALNYLSYRYSINNQKGVINKSDLLYGVGFVEKFFEYRNPILSSQDSRLWIYPKIIFKEYLSNCVKSNDYEASFIDDLTLDKLIMIMAGFVKYEFQNGDEYVASLAKNLNLPTMILANIRLYEKGIIKIISDGNDVGITLEMNPIDKNKKNFTNNINRIKNKIIEIINQNENQKFSLNDFLE